MTEDEAREKWCPYRATGQREEYSKRVPTPRNSCIASECMAWRVGGPADEFAPTDGYCGLSGRP